MEKFCPSKSSTLFLDDQSDEMQEESQKEVVFIGNKGSDSEDDTGHEKFRNSIRHVVRCTLASLKILLTYVESRSSTHG